MRQEINFCRDGERRRPLYYRNAFRTPKETILLAGEESENENAQQEKTHMFSKRGRACRNQQDRGCSSV